MNSTLDLDLLLIARRGNEDLVDSPDLFTAAPPRRAARGREADQLVIYFSLTGNAPLSPAEHAGLMESLAQKFYKTSGSLTAALRTLAETVNLNLLDRNLRSTGAGRQAIGQLLLVALRGDALYIAQSGAVQAYLVKPAETQSLFDLQTSGRGLGLSRATPVRFLQINMTTEDYLVLSTIPSTAWTGASIQHPAQGGVNNLRHQLLLKASQDFNAVIVQAQAGSGKLKVLKRKPGEPIMAAPSPATAKPAQPAQVEAISPPPVEPAPGELPVPSATPSPGEPAPEAPVPVAPAGPVSETPPVTGKVPSPLDESQEVNSPTTSAALAAVAATSTSSGRAKPMEELASSAPAPLQATPVPAGASPQPVKPTTKTPPPAQPASPPSQAPNTQAPARPSPGSEQLRALRGFLLPIAASIGGSLRRAFGVFGKSMLRLLKNLLPDADVLHLPASTMVFIAIAIPLILAVLGGMVFLQRGQAQQHQVYYQQAVEKADYAATLTNPLEQRLALQTALGALDKAEEYTVTSQSQALRAQLTASLDTLDAVKRLDYKQAIVNGLDSGVRVTRIVASAADLYLLDGNTGSVLHAVMTTRGYELDPAFKCGPTQGPIDVGPLVDIVELPPGGIENASLLGMDANGNLLYCVVGAQPYSNTLAPPNAGLGSPVGLSMDRGDLYVLDPSVNAVWIYRNMEVGQPPRYFFGDEVPPMEDVIDMEVYNDDLYMLHADGHTTKCTYSGMAESPTRCEDPYPYSDNRPGRTHGPVVEDAIFSQMDYITFPERSIFYLDPQHQAIYYFSVLLTLQYQYQPKVKLADGEATAFSVSANRIAFLAVGNQVFYAAMP